MYYIIIAVVIAADQLTKYMVQTNMDLNDTIPLIDGIFHFTYIHNYGAAFSIMENRQVLLLVLTGTVICGILIYMIKNQRILHSSAKLSMALIVGGGLGNLIDRMFRGYVVDFFDFRVWPIFNIADIAVVCGCTLLVVYLLIIEPKLQKKSQSNMERSLSESGEEQHASNRE